MKTVHNLSIEEIHSLLQIAMTKNEAGKTYLLSELLFPKTDIEVLNSVGGGCTKCDQVEGEWIVFKSYDIDGKKTLFIPMKSDEGFMPLHVSPGVVEGVYGAFNVVPVLEWFLLNGFEDILSIQTIDYIVRNRKKP